MSRWVSSELEPKERAREPGGEVRQGEGAAWGNPAGIHLGLTLSLSFHCGPRAYGTPGALVPPYADKETGEASSL